MARSRSWWHRPPSARVGLAGLGLLLAASTAAPQPPASAPTEARLDFVLRDRKGLPVRDLKAEEVEVFEAGTKRAPLGLRLVEPGTGGEAGAPRYLSLVFDGLDAEGQKNARKAALEFVARAAAPDVRFAVFRVGLELWAVQGFTGDAALARAAVEKAASPEDQGLAPVSSAARTQAARELGVPETAAAARALVDVLRVGDEMQKMRQDQSSLYPLLAVAKGQAQLPGRKTVVYFSQGLFVPSRLDDVFRSLLSEANRASVALYTIDARGLRTQGDLEATRSAMQDVNRAGLEQARDSVTQQRGVGDFRAVERVAESVKQGETNALKELAEATGAAYLGNTNDLRKAADRILSDSTSYYEVLYPPVSPALDGAFRTTEVKVSRPGLKVAERSGYFALPRETGGPTILADEIPMIAALGANPPPADFGVRAGALVFGGAEKGREVVLLAEVPLSGLSFAVDEAAKTYRLRFAVLARVRDREGAVAYTVSQSYPFEGPVDKLDALKRGNVVFRRTVGLPAGRYTFEVAVQDRETKAAAVARSGFDVGSSSPLQVGSLSVIRRVDQLPADKATGADPFRVEALRIVPNLDAPVSKAAATNLSLFLPLYAAGTEAVSLTLELSKGGARVAAAEVPLPAREPDGRIPAVATFSLSAFEPGLYEVTATAKQGSNTAQQKGAFSVVP